MSFLDFIWEGDCLTSTPSHLGHQKGSKRIERLQPIEEVVKAVDALFRSTPAEVGELRSQPGPGASVKLQQLMAYVNAEDYNCEILSRKLSTTPIIVWNSLVYTFFATLNNNCSCYLFWTGFSHVCPVWDNNLILKSLSPGWTSDVRQTWGGIHTATSTDSDDMQRSILYIYISIV